MGQVPCLVTEPELRAPQSRDDQRDQRVDRQSAKGGAPRRFENIKHGHPLRPEREEEDDVQDDEGDCDQRYPAVKVINDVFAAWLRNVSEARREAELQTHHRQARVSDRDGELPPEIARRWREGSCQQREQRGEDEQKVNEEPNGAAQDVAKLHGLIQSASSRPNEDHDHPQRRKRTHPASRSNHYACAHCPSSRAIASRQPTVDAASLRLKTPPRQTPARLSGPTRFRSAQSNAVRVRGRSRQSPRGDEGKWSRPRLSC